MAVPSFCSYRTRISKIHQKFVLQHLRVKFCGKQDSYVYFNSSKFQLQILSITWETKVGILVPCFYQFQPTFFTFGSNPSIHSKPHISSFEKLHNPLKKLSKTDLRWLEQFGLQKWRQTPPWAQLGSRKIEGLVESENGIFEGCFALFCFVVLEGKEGLERMEKSVGKVLGFGCFGVLGFALFVFVFLFLSCAGNGCNREGEEGNWLYQPNSTKGCCQALKDST